MFNIGAAFIKAVVGGIYRTVARAYELMYDFVTEGNFSLGSDLLEGKIDSMTDSIYTLIAVFMLFRITVTMIEYLIDPDKLTDKSSGTGKLITRIIISLLLVISFNSIIMPKLIDLQNALLSPDSIIFKFFEVGNANAASSECINKINSAKQFAGATTTGSAGLEELIANCEFDSSFMSAVNSQIDDFNISGVAISCKINGKTESCDNYLGKGYYVTNGSYSTSKNGMNRKFVINITENKQEAEKFESGYDSGYSTGQINSGVYESLDELSDTPGGNFALDVASSFSTKPEKVKETKFIGSPSGLNEFATLVEEEEIDYDTFLSIICGIILIVILLVLCIEVIIRNLKLIILQLLAPIAFISYINPNDKVLNNWFKKFLSCYLDLFIKLFAIQIAIYLIELISSGLGGGLQKILVYLAIFIFAKTIPNLISDIFGIKDMGGTFKESMGALKSAALYGTSMAGGAIGGVAALAGGATLGQAGKVFTSGFGGKPANVNKAYGTARGAAQKRKASGTSWSDAQKAEFPWNRSIEQVEEAKKSAGANYKSLDGALEGSVFSANKSMQQLQNLYDNGTFEEKFKYADAFGVKDMNAFNRASTEEKLNMLDEAWGDKKGLEMAKVLIDSQNAVKSGNANAFQQTVVNLAQKVDLSEKNVGVNISGVSKARTVDEAKVSLKIAKEHNKSGYRTDQLTPTEQKQAQKNQNNSNNP